MNRRSQGNFEEVAVFLVEKGADPNDVYTDDKGKQHNLLFDSVTLGNEVRVSLTVIFTFHPGHGKTSSICSGKFSFRTLLDADKSNVSLSFRGCCGCLLMTFLVQVVEFIQLRSVVVFSLVSCTKRLHRRTIIFLIGQNPLSMKLVGLPIFVSDVAQQERQRSHWRVFLLLNDGAYFLVWL